MRFSRKAAEGLSGWSMSATARYSSFVPTSAVRVRKGARVALLLTWLMAPPVEPRPNRVAEGPLMTSTSCRSKSSRS